MAIMRIKNRLNASSPAPPPSPIPTANGSRSTTDSALSSFIDKSKLVPELTLPDYIYRSVIADIDYASLNSRDADSVHGVVRSARESGVFRISNHGIEAEDLRLTLSGERSDCFGLMAESFRRFDDREEFLWRRSAVQAKERGRRVAGARTYRSFSKIENAATKLEAIAEELTQIIASNRSAETSKRIQLNASKLTLSRHNNAAQEHQNLPSLNKSCKYVWSLHLPLDHGEFVIKSEGGPLSSFITSSDTIVVTVGELLEEWSLGEFKSAYGELNFVPELQGIRSQPSFSIELKCCPSYLNHAFDDKRISVANQVFVIIFVILLYKLFAFIFA